MQEEKRSTARKAALIWRFLKGSKGMFALSMLMAAITALADMVTPQIIRAAVDNAIGGNEPSFGPTVMRLVDAVGGLSIWDGTCGLWHWPYWWLRR